MTTVTPVAHSLLDFSFSCLTGASQIVVYISPIYSTWSLVHLDFSFSCLTGASQIVVYISPIDNFVSLAKTRFVIWGGAILH